MSYILEALRKSEIERKQGEIPDLGASVQIVHKPRKQAPSLLIWLVVVALLANAALLAWLFWPRTPADLSLPEPITQRAPVPAQTVPEKIAEPTAAPPASAPVAAAEGQAAPTTAVRAVVADVVAPDAAQTAEPAMSAPEAAEPPAEASPVLEVSLSVPNLGSMPADFQRQVPDLTFNSHIYSSSADARRVMINNEYLKEGARFSGMVVEEITEDGVILSLQGQSFVVSVVRNWNAPR